jgi:hypothetical protein
LHDQIKSADAGKMLLYDGGDEFNPTAVMLVVIGNGDFNSTSTLDGLQIPNGTTITWTVTDAAGFTASCGLPLP